MCGRFTLRTPSKDIAALFRVDELPAQRPRYNIAPTQDVAAVRSPQPGQRRLSLLRWGLIPFWADDPKIGYRTINARAETVASKPSFRAAFKKRRCLVIADGFYEWRKTNAKKQPYYIRTSNRQPFAFAGLWESWQPKGAERDSSIESCTIIVTEANDLVEPIHDRMPVILSPDDYELWLDPEFEGKDRLQELLRPYPADAMEAYPVATLVNNPRHDDPHCIDPLAD